MRIFKNIPWSSILMIGVSSEMICFDDSDLLRKTLKLNLTLNLILLPAVELNKNLQKHWNQYRQKKKKKKKASRSNRRVTLEFAAKIHENSDWSALRRIYQDEPMTSNSRRRVDRSV